MKGWIGRNIEKKKRIYKKDLERCVEVYNYKVYKRFGESRVMEVRERLGEDKVTVY